MKRIHLHLARLKIGQKLVLSSAVAALPITVLLYFVVAGYGRGILNSQGEISAARDLQVYSSLITDLRLLQSWKHFKAAGVVSEQTAASEPVNRIDARIAAARVAASRLAANAGTTETIERLEGLWRQFRNRGGKMTPRESSMTFRLMLDSAGQLCNSTAEQRLLVLDSGADSYYLIKVAGPLLLQAQTALARSRLVIQQANADGELTQRDLAALQLQGDLLSESLIPMLQLSLDTAVQEDEKVRGTKTGLKTRLAPPSQRYLAALTEVSSQLGRFSSISDMNLTADQIVRSAAIAENQGALLWLSALQELTLLLEDRLSEDRFNLAEALLLSFLSLAMASCAVFIVTRNITNPLDRLVSLTTQIAGGRVKEARERLDSDEFQDLLAAHEHGYEPRDETYALLRSMASMTDSLNALIIKVSQACNQVASSANLTADTVHDIESAVSEQAASTHQVTATSKQIYSTVQDLAKTMQSVTRMASSAARKASEGMGSLEGIRAAAAALMEASQAVTCSFEAIQDKTGNIDRVITEITKIANRTNLLSLNAAIEAEKAGEMAGGFSVVALEVRKLADQTAVAALDIERRIREMQDAVRDGLASAGSYTEQARASSAAAAELSAGLTKVIERTTQLGPEFESVNQGMQVQSEGAGQIADSMQHLRDAASNTKGSLADFRRVGENLHKAVGDLQSEVGRFSAAS